MTRPSRRASEVLDFVLIIISLLYHWLGYESSVKDGKSETRLNMSSQVAFAAPAMVAIAV